MENSVLGIHLIPVQAKVSPEELRQMFPNATTIVAVDLYLQGAETWERIPGGWQGDVGGVCFINVDHHAPAKDMMRFVSSGTLAKEFVRERGHVEASNVTVLVINHCDTDSVVAAAILLGIVNSEALLQEAVIAADHTGEEHPVADALQALEANRDLQLSLQTLFALVERQSLPEEAQRAVEARQEERAEIEALLRNAPEQVHWKGNVVVIEADTRLAAEMLPGLLPEAAVIATMSPVPDGTENSRKWHAKLRLGMAAPTGATLHSLNIPSFDPLFGGRWNAGSNKRGENSGTELSPVEYLAKLAATVETHFTAEA